LKEEVLVDIYKKILKKSHLIQDNFTEKTINKLCIRIKEQKIVPDEIIFSKGDLATNLIFVLSGQIEIFLSN
jgi:hypothetical protein